MYRVAAVASLVCNNFDEEVDTDNIISADLLHDMGNIIKFNLELFPEFLEPEGKSYWENVKREFISKYGNDEHTATFMIARELNITERIDEILHSIGAAQTKRVYDLDDKALWIANYADYRVAPYGVVQLSKRLEDGRKRYVGNKGPHSVSKEKSEEIEKFSYSLEKNIQQHLSISVDSINDEAVSDIVEMLPNFEIKTQ